MASTVGAEIAPGAGGRRARAPQGLWPLAAIVVLGAALRFSTLSEQSLWYDEAVTHTIVAHGLAHVLRAVPQTESTPPLYYVLAWLWTRVFGVGEAGLRSFSALCGTATIFFMWLLGRRLATVRVGLIAALLTAVNPFLFYYSQEARSYALLTLLSTASLLLALRAADRPSRRRMLGWGLLAAAALAVHYFAVFILVPEGAWLLWRLRRQRALTREHLLPLLGPPALLALPLGLLAIHQNDGRASYIAGSGSLPYRLAQLGKQDLIGDGQPHKLLLAGCGALIVLLAGLLLVRFGTEKQRAAAVWGTAIGLAGVALAVLVSALGTDYLNSRNLLPTWPALSLAVAAGLGVEGARARAAGATGAALLTALSLLCVSIVVLDVDYQRDDWRDAAHALGRAGGPRVILADRYDSRAPLAVYLPGVGEYPPSGVAVREVDILWIARPQLGRRVLAITPRPLPGFTLTLRQRRQYAVVRYHTIGSAPLLEPTATLAALYPDASRSLVLLQR